MIVSRSHPASCRSRIACDTSARSSPSPRMRLDLVTRLPARASRSTSSDRSYRNAGRIRLKILGTVSRLWASTSGPAPKTSASSTGSPEKSGISNSTPMPGVSR